MHNKAKGGLRREHWIKSIYLKNLGRFWLAQNGAREVGKIS